VYSWISIHFIASKKQSSPDSKDDSHYRQATRTGGSLVCLCVYLAQAIRVNFVNNVMKRQC